MNPLRIFIIALAVLTAGTSFAQEVLFPLNSNPALHRKTNVSYRTQAVGDTLDLPFVEDFSLNSIYPTPTLWLEKDVYVNNNYSANPVTIGVGTFDGLDEFGHPYQASSIGDSIADYLTSFPIKLLNAQ